MTTSFQRLDHGESDTAIDGKISLIDATTFCDMAISSRRLERVWEPSGLFGLRDVVTGERYLVDSKLLGRHRLSCDTN